MHPHAIPGISDPVSSSTHLFGAIVYAIASIWLLRNSLRFPGRFWPMAVFVGSAIFLLTMSGIYHLVERGQPARLVFERLDHLGIFLLIAGTFTPPVAIMFVGKRRRWLLTGIWGTTLAAITVRFTFFETISHFQGVLLYLAIGWMGIVPVSMILKHRGIDFVLPLFLGAFVYTFGGIMEAVGEPIVMPGVMGPHEQFHVAVLLGIGMHWLFMFTISKGPVEPIRYGVDDDSTIVEEFSDLELEPAPVQAGIATKQERRTA